MKIILSHPTGNANVRATANAFVHAGILAAYHTTIACFDGDFLDKLSRIGPLAEIKRRKYDSSLHRATKTFPWFEICRLLSTKFGFSKFIEHETGLFSIDSVYRKLDNSVAHYLKSATVRNINSIYAYEDGAAYSFAKGKSLGLKCFYDLPTGHWRAAHQLLQDEREKTPEWASTLTGLKDSEEKLTCKDNELQMADRVFVASQFTANTLKSFPHSLAPVSVIPYGFPPVTVDKTYTKRKNNQVLKILFVGKLSQQKGISYLFDATKNLKDHISLTIVGQKVTDKCLILDENLRNHHWIPSLPHSAILKLMKEHDILIFPSLFDGFGLVITEAMSQGTPVIATERSAGPDLIKHGESGWLARSSSTESLQEIIEKIILDPSSVDEVGRNAMKTAMLRPWEIYQEELVATILKEKQV